MNNKPTQIPEDIAAKFDQKGQFDTFDEAFRKVIVSPADRVPPPKDMSRRPGEKGRPRK
jgi:hypothetical protein